MNTDIELFNNVANRNNHSKQPLNRVINWMQTNQTLKQKTMHYRKWLFLNPDATKKQKSDQKVSHFPAVTFSGTFTGTGQAKDINQMSGLIVIDFDHINVNEVREKLKSDPYTFLLFLSPSIDGLKAVIKHNLTEPENWKYLYLELEAYYKTLGLETDKSGKDINRMCFLPYSEDLYKNDGSKVWQFSGVPEKPTQTRTASLTIETDDKLYNECYCLAGYLFKYKIDITANYDDWISYGYSLCHFGEQGREIYHMMSGVNNGYESDDTDQNYDYMLSHYDPEKTGINLFMSMSKKAIVEYQLFKEFGLRNN